jgi:hypothetical protein
MSKKKMNGSSPARTVTQWADVIATTWRNAVASIIETGKLLTEAKGSLPHGEWLGMVNDQLPFGPRAAQQLMQIAAHEVLSNAKYCLALPPSWGTLAELARIEPERCLKLIEDRTINPGMSRDDASLILRTMTVKVTPREPDRMVRVSVAPAPPVPQPEPQPASESSPQVWVCDACGDHSHKSCGCDSAVADGGTRELNAVGKPLSPSYDPKYKIRGRSPNALLKNTQPLGKDAVSEEREQELMTEYGLVPLWFKEPEVVAARLAAAYTIEQIAGICAKAIDLKKAAQA